MCIRGENGVSFSDAAFSMQDGKYDTEVINRKSVVKGTSEESLGVHREEGVQEAEGWWRLLPGGNQTL